MFPVIILIAFIHWFADYVLQTCYLAKNKSKSLRVLLTHTALYSVCWFALWPFLGMNTIYFVGITFIAHTLTDFFTSKLNSKFKNEKNERGFYISVGFDQFLHYAQLFLTFNLFYELAWKNIKSPIFSWPCPRCWHHRASPWSWTENR